MNLNLIVIVVCCWPISFGIMLCGKHFEAELVVVKIIFGKIYASKNLTIEHGHSMWDDKPMQRKQLLLHLNLN